VSDRTRGRAIRSLVVSGYDEFALLAENAAEYGLSFQQAPAVRRESVALPSGLELSALVWGDGSPELVLVHGGAQNAHTWDTVLLALGRPALAVDLPGHGHSSHRPAHDYTPRSMAADVAVAVEQLAPAAAAVVGMSLGGMTAICLAANRPGLVRRLGVVDVTPGTDREKAEPIIAFVDGPETFADFDEILARTIEFNPGRSEQSLRRGVLHNAYELDDGRWTWRYDRLRDWKTGEADAPDHTELWDLVGLIEAPITLWQGGRWSVVADEDIAEWMRRQPTTNHMVVADAGHSIQGDRPVELARLIDELLSVPV